MEPLRYGIVGGGFITGFQLRALICEKPLARNLGEARRVLELAHEIGAPTAYFENQIHMKTVRAALEQLRPAMDAMGPLALARAAEEHAGPHAAWFWDPTRQGGGVLSDMGCHSIALSWYALTPPGRPVRRSKGQFTVSWMYDKQGLRLLLDGLGPGYALEANSLRSPLEVFIGDEAAAGVGDAELALEKATASRGLLAIQPNEADLYGYTDENVEAVAAFRAGRSGLLDFEYGLEIVRLTMAAYLSAESGRVVDLRDPETLRELEDYVPLIQQGRGSELLHPEWVASERSYAQQEEEGR